MWCGFFSRAELILAGESRGNDRFLGRPAVARWVRRVLEGAWGRNAARNVAGFVAGVGFRAAVRWVSCLFLRSGNGGVVGVMGGS